MLQRYATADNTTLVSFNLLPSITVRWTYEPVTVETTLRTGIRNSVWQHEYR